MPPLQPAFTTRAAPQPDLLHFPPRPLNCHAEVATLCVLVCARSCVAGLACRHIVFQFMLEARTAQGECFHSFMASWIKFCLQGVQLLPALQGKKQFK